MFLQITQTVKVNLLSAVSICEQDGNLRIYYSHNTIDIVSDPVEGIVIEESEYCDGDLMVHVLTTHPRYAKIAQWIDIATLD